VIFETLSDKHLHLLFQFELDNRQWFESLISPREDYFYTTAGIKMHIFDSVINMQLGTHYSGVLIQNDRIVARGNLKDISVKKQNASVGYRVAEQNTGNGYASYCLTELLRIANDVYSLKELEALVLDNNPASKEVLQKRGFNAEYYQVNFMELNKIKLGCTTFKKVLS